MKLTVSVSMPTARRRVGQVQAAHARNVLAAAAAGAEGAPLVQRRQLAPSGVVLSATRPSRSHTLSAVVFDWARAEGDYRRRFEPIKIGPLAGSDGRLDGVSNDKGWRRDSRRIGRWRGHE